MGGNHHKRVAQFDGDAVACELVVASVLPVFEGELGCVETANIGTAKVGISSD